VIDGVLVLTLHVLGYGLFGRDRFFGFGMRFSVCYWKAVDREPLWEVFLGRDSVRCGG
jgi:hypothetical protein